MTQCDLKNTREPDKWRTKEEMAGHKTIYGRWKLSESHVLMKQEKKSSEDLTRFFIDWSVICWSLIKNGLNGRLAVKKLFSWERKGWDISNYTKKIWLKISNNRSQRMILIFWFKLPIICLKNAKSEVQHRVSRAICKRQWKFSHGLGFCL